jgi:hypothetical protein
MHDISLILDALESYQLEGGWNWPNIRTPRCEYVWTETDVENLAKYLNGMLDENND